MATETQGHDVQLTKDLVILKARHRELLAAVEDLQRSRPDSVAGSSLTEVEAESPEGGGSQTTGELTDSESGLFETDSPTDCSSSASTMGVAKGGETAHGSSVWTEVITKDSRRRAKGSDICPSTSSGNAIATKPSENSRILKFRPKAKA